MTLKRVWGIAAVLIGLMCGIGMVALAATGFGSQMTFTSPGPVTTNLPAGKWTVFQVLSQSAAGTTPGDFAQQRTIDAKAVTVRGPDGKAVATNCAYCGADQPGVVPIDLQIAVPVVEFDASTSGDYTIVVSATSPTPVAVANPIQRITEMAPWLTGLIFAAGMFVTFGIVLIATGGRSASVRRPNGGVPPPPSLPPGWYPNPYRPESGEMWWDGKQWTSNWR